MSLAVAAMGDVEGISMQALVEQLLPFRTYKYLQDFLEKLLAEGIANPADLHKVSRSALETKLSTHSSFNLIEMADAVSLRDAGRRVAEDWKSVLGESTGNQTTERRARSRSRNGMGRKAHQGKGGTRGSKNNSRPQRGFSNGPDNRPQQRRMIRCGKDKPELWMAAQENNSGAALELLRDGADIEEKHEGWTPLMKASEENSLEVLRMLIDKKGNLEATNRKGRTPLSFAAAPSDDGSKLRPTALKTLRLLLESGADAKHKDDRGNTAKDYASRHKREDALQVFEEFGF